MWTQVQAQLHVCDSKMVRGARGGSTRSPTQETAWWVDPTLCERRVKPAR